MDEVEEQITVLSLEGNKKQTISPAEETVIIRDAS